MVESRLIWSCEHYVVCVSAKFSPPEGRTSDPLFIDNSGCRTSWNVATRRALPGSDLISAIGLLGSAVSQAIIGVLRDLTGSFLAGLFYVTGLLVRRLTTTKELARIGEELVRQLLGRPVYEPLPNWASLPPIWAST